MRKTVILGLFALILSVFSSLAIAGTVVVCEEQKDELKSMGLYGLCNAYWNADNESARAQILANFEEKAGTADGGPGMPGLNPPAMSCPCWVGVELDEIDDYMETAFCILNDSTGDSAFFGIYNNSSGDQFYNYNVTVVDDRVVESCIHLADYTTDAGDEITKDVSISGLEEMGAQCAMEMDDIINTYFENGNVCWSPPGS